MNIVANQEKLLDSLREKVDENEQLKIKLNGAEEACKLLRADLDKDNKSAAFYKEQYEKADRECTKLAMREAKANERVYELELSMGKLRTEILQACVEGSSSSGGIKKSAAHHLHDQALMIPPYAKQLRKEQV